MRCFRLSFLLWSAYIVKTFVAAKNFPPWLLRHHTGLGCRKAATLGMRPLDDLNGIVGRQFHSGMKHNIPMERHFPVFDHRRDCRQKQPLLGRVETIPAR